MPLFRDIPGAEVLLKIINLLVKNKKEKIFDLLGRLVKLILVGMICVMIEKDKRLAKSKEAIEKLIEKISFGEKMVEGIVQWLKGVMYLLEKERKNLTMDKVM